MPNDQEVRGTYPRPDLGPPGCVDPRDNSIRLARTSASWGVATSRLNSTGGVIFAQVGHAPAASPARASPARTRACDARSGSPTLSSQNHGRQLTPGPCPVGKG